MPILTRCCSPKRYDRGYITNCILNLIGLKTIVAKVFGLLGVTLVESTAVGRVLSEDGRVSGVETRGGQRVACEFFVNCAGFWAREVGRLSQPAVKVPIHACQHYYLHTQPIPGLDERCPAVRDLDGYVYFRENNGRLLCGGFEPSAKPAFEDGVLPGQDFFRIYLSGV